MDEVWDSPAGLGLSARGAVLRGRREPESWSHRAPSDSPRSLACFLPLLRHAPGDMAKQQVVSFKRLTTPTKDVMLFLESLNILLDSVMVVTCISNRQSASPFEALFPCLVRKSINSKIL